MLAALFFGAFVPGAAAQDASPTSPSGRQPCEDGRLLVGDLPKIDDRMMNGLAVATERGAEWQPDARLVAFRVSCDLFKPGFRFDGTYFSDSAQIVLDSETGEISPTYLEPSNVLTLTVQGLSYKTLYTALVKAGFTDDLEISASTGVDLQVNSSEPIYGPPGAPRGQPLFHVAVLRKGEVKDLFVDAETGLVYIFQIETGG